MRVLSFFCVMAALTVILSTQTKSQDASSQRFAAKLYTDNCAGCHGTRLQGSQGPSLIRPDYLHGTRDDEVLKSIKDGFPDRGMPGWAEVLAASEIQALVGYIGEQRSENSPERLATLDRAQIAGIPKGKIRTEVQSFRISLVSEFGKPWGLSALPDGRLLMTEDVGNLRVIDRDGKVGEPVSNTPRGEAPNDVFKRVLMDVAVHPDYANNGWIYILTGAHVAADNGNPSDMVSIVRGRLRGNEWVDSQALVTLPLNTDTGRLVFDTHGHIFLSSANEGGINEAHGVEPMAPEVLLSMEPQDLASPQGKILRFMDDGSIPPDNPFAERSGALASIWSVGHRNPQGLAFDSNSGRLWSSEHGPRGGDELNLIQPGHNYGWPVISYGTRYDGIAFTTEVEHEGMDQPIINWTPSPGLSNLIVYQGRSFPKWRHNLLLGSLKQQELFRIVVSGQTVVLRESILKDVGRIRNIAVGADGMIYLAMELRTKGILLKLEPAR